MIPQPIYRESLQKLNIETIEYNRLVKINSIVSEIYKQVIYVAKNTQNKIYEFPIPRENDRSLLINNFYKENISDIILSLQKIFPDSIVAHLILAKGSDGKLYDIAKIDDKILPLLTVASNSSYIVINWN